MSQPKVVAVHQPNFFPWLGYFNKIVRADIFVFLDNVQFPKTGGTWTNRVRLIVGDKAGWVTMPIVRAYHGLRLVSEMQINNTISWKTRFIKTIQTSYGRAPFFRNVFPIITQLVNNPIDSLSEYNVSTIFALMSALKFDPSKLILGSKLHVDGQATDLLVDIVKAVEGSAYLCGGGANGYQKDEKFATTGIELIYQSFRHPVHPQICTKEFVPGLSIIDALMNCGLEGTRALIEAT